MYRKNLTENAGNHFMRKNAVFMMIYEVAIYLSPLITAPYIARILGTYGTGVYSYTVSIATYFMVLTQLGVKMYGRREIATCLTREERSKTFWGIWIIESVMFLVCTVTYGTFVLLYDTDLKIAFALQYMTIASAWLDISWMFFGVEDFKIAVTRNVLVKFLSMILVFALVRKREDYNLYVLIMAASNLASVVIMWLTVKKHISFVSLTAEDIRKHWMPMVQMFIPMISIQLYSMTDKVFLGAMKSTDAVGIYENAYKIARMPVQLIASIGMVMLPRMTQLIAQGREKEADGYFEQSFSITFIIGLTCAFGLIGIAKTFIPLYLGSEFTESIIILQLLSLFLIAIGWGNPFRNQFILPKKMDSLYIRSVLFGAILNIVLNSILIPLFSTIGAAVATLIAEYAICVYQCWKIRQFFDFKKIMLDNAKYVLCAVGMCVIVALLGDKMGGSPYVKLIVQVVVGGSAFFIGSCLLEWFSGRLVILAEIQRLLPRLLKKVKGK